MTIKLLTLTATLATASLFGFVDLAQAGCTSSSNSLTSTIYYNCSNGFSGTATNNSLTGTTYYYNY